MGFVLRYRNKLFGGALISQLGTNLFIMIFVIPSFLVTRMFFGPGIEQNALYFSGESRGRVPTTGLVLIS